jgi:glycerate dehydrogenase
MSKLHAVFLDATTVDADDIDWAPLQQAVGDLICHPTTAAADVSRRIARAQVVISNKIRLDADTLESASGLRLICIAATGTNNVDLEAAGRLGITVCNVRDYATPAVAQHVFAMVLAMATRLIDYRESVRAGDWSRANQFCLLDHPIFELAGKRLGIIGHGVLGRAVAALGQAFGMEVLISQRPGGEPQPGRVPLDELLTAVDVLSLHCPLAPETRGLIGAAELERMKPTALLINTARGGIVDESALANALRSGQIAGAGFDVLTVEPPRDGNPLLAADIPNLILTPHTAWASRESRQRMVAELALNIRGFSEGRPRNRVA